MRLELEIRRHSASTPWSYADLDFRQRDLASQVRSAGEQTAFLLLSEFAPVITLGRRAGCERDLLVGADVLSARGIDIFRTDRGGFATYHGPGQWVLFLVGSLEALTGDRRGVRRVVEGLLGAVLEVGLEYCPHSEICMGKELGVWNKNGKFAALGIHVDNGILLHGISVNGFNTPPSFFGLKPCGLDAPVAYLLEGSGAGEGGAESGFDELGERLVGAVSRAFLLKMPRGF